MVQKEGRKTWEVSIFHEKPTPYTNTFLSNLSGVKATEYTNRNRRTFI